MSDNKRIAKNTLFLYGRMLIVLVVGLLTSRVVLNKLGVDDYGIYNVVGGFVTIFGFLNGAMANATQRSITFELALGDLEKQIKTFSTSVNLHLFLAIIIAFFAETVGLWFLYHKMTIPTDRMDAAFWVYQLSVAATVMIVMSVPYTSTIIAHEAMDAFAWISIMDIFLKLVIVYAITLVESDRLIFYATLLFLVQLLDQIIYRTYCHRKFKEARYRMVFDKFKFKEMSNIAGWSLFGNIAGVGYTQGLNVLLNMFFGPTVNAARGIAVTVQGVVSGFISNIQMAINPQITKSYASANLYRMHSLIFSSSKFCFFLLLMIVLPIILEAGAILKLWLKIVPEYTEWFVRIILLIMLTDTLSNPMMVSSQAVGKVKIYQSVVGGILLMILPISYFVLRSGASPLSVFIVQLVVSCIATFLRVLIVSRMIDLSLKTYFVKVIVRIVPVFLISLSISGGCKLFMHQGLLYSLVIIIISPVVVAFTVITIGLSKEEKEMCKILLRKFNLKLCKG